LKGEIYIGQGGVVSGKNNNVFVVVVVVFWREGVGIKERKCLTLGDEKIV